jgi:hypothetical protein
LFTERTSTTVAWDGVFSSISYDTLPVCLLSLCQEWLDIICTYCTAASLRYLLPFIFLFPLTNEPNDTEQQPTAAPPSSSASCSPMIDLLHDAPPSAEWFVDKDLIHVGQALFCDARLYEYATVRQAAIPFIVQTISNLEGSLYESLPEQQAATSLSLPNITYELVRTIRLVSALLKVLHSFPAEFVASVELDTIYTCLRNLLAAIRPASRKYAYDNQLLVVCSLRVLSSIGICHANSLVDAFSWKDLSALLLNVVATLQETLFKKATKTKTKAEGDSNNEGGNSRALTASTEVAREFRHFMRIYFDVSQAAVPAKLLLRCTRALTKSTTHFEAAVFVLCITSYLDALLSINNTLGAIQQQQAAGSQQPNKCTHTYLLKSLTKLTEYFCAQHCRIKASIQGSTEHTAPEACTFVLNDSLLLECSTRALGLLNVMAAITTLATEQQSELEKLTSTLGRSTWLALQATLVHQHNVLHASSAIIKPIAADSDDASDKATAATTSTLCVSASNQTQALGLMHEQVQTLACLRLLFRSCDHKKYLSANEYIRFLLQFCRAKLVCCMQDAQGSSNRLEYVRLSEALGEVIGRASIQEFELLLNHKTEYVTKSRLAIPTNDRLTHLCALQ